MIRENEKTWTNFSSFSWKLGLRLITVKKAQGVTPRGFTWKGPVFKFLILLQKMVESRAYTQLFNPLYLFIHKSVTVYASLPRPPVFYQYHYLCPPIRDQGIAAYPSWLNYFHIYPRRDCIGGSVCWRCASYLGLVWLIIRYGEIKAVNQCVSHFSTMKFAQMSYRHISICFIQYSWTCFHEQRCWLCVMPNLERRLWSREATTHICVLYFRRFWPSSFYGWTSRLCRCLPMIFCSLYTSHCLIKCVSVRRKIPVLSASLSDES